MTKDQYRELLPLVNDGQSYGLLKKYAEYKIEVLRGYLENQKEPTKIYELQGAIAELRRIATDRKSVV